MFDLVYYSIYWVAMLSVLPLLFILFNLRKKLSPALQSLHFLFWISAICDLISFFIARFRGNTHLIFHIYNIFESAAFLYFFYHIFKIPKLKKLVLIGGIILFIVCTLSFFEKNAFLEVNDIVSYTQSIVITIFSIFFFYQILELLDEPVLKNSHLFWINTGILVYSALPLFVFLTYRLIANVNEYRSYSWAIYLISDILFHIFIFIGLWKYKTKQV